MSRHGIVVSLLVAGTAWADPVVLDAPQKAAALCVSLQPTERLRFKDGQTSAAEQRTTFEEKRKAARDQVYQLTLQSKEFQVAETDAAAGTLTIDTTRPFRGASASLTVYDIEVDELTLHAAPGKVKEVTDAVTSGRAALVLTFKPAADEDSPCFSTTARAYILAVDFVTAEIREGATVLARATEEEGFPPVASSAGKPTVDVVALSGEGGTPVPTDVAAGVAKVKPGAQRCYEQALSKDPALDGSVVFAWETKSGKAVPLVQADSLQNDEVVDCLKKALSVVSLPNPKKTTVAIHLMRE